MLQVIGKPVVLLDRTRLLQRVSQTVTECQSDWTRLLQSVSWTVTECQSDCYRVSVRLDQSVIERVSVRLVPNCYRECQTGPQLLQRVSVRLDPTVTESVRLDQTVI